MEIIISDTKQELGQKAAQMGAELIRKAILENGKANIIVATGASQFEMLTELVKEDINWSVVTAFHLDEYVGMSELHPASKVYWGTITHPASRNRRLSLAQR